MLHAPARLDRHAPPFFFVNTNITKNSTFYGKGPTFERKKAPASNTAGTNTEFGSNNFFSKKAQIQLSNSYEWSH